MINLEIMTHDGEVYDIPVGNYDAEDMNNQLNDNEVNTVVIGAYIFSRFDIKRIITKD